MATAVLTAAPARTYQIDVAHSEVGFTVRHLLSRVRGRFTDFSGAIGFDPSAPEHSSVSFAVKAASIDTANADRDAHLRSNDFFGTETFPELRFTSTSVTPRGAGRFDVTGQLTIRDVTRTVVLPVTYLGSATDPWGKQKLAFDTAITINRKDYGLVWNAVLETGGFVVGDEVQISVSIQAA
jgi:polyisoprenoid-binding protein YceI